MVIRRFRYRIAIQHVEDERNERRPTAKVANFTAGHVAQLAPPLALVVCIGFQPNPDCKKLRFCKFFCHLSFLILLI